MNVNLSSIRNTVTRSFGRTGLVAQKHAPEILLGLGLVGGVVAAVLAAKATLKLEGVLIDHDENLAKIEFKTVFPPDAEGNRTSQEDANKQKAMVYLKTGVELTKLYGPALSIGAASVGAILASHGVMKNRQVALISAYTVLQEGYKAYRNRVVEELGEEKERLIHLGLKEETITTEEVNEDGKKVKGKKTVLVHDGFPSVYAVFFDESSPNWRTDAQLNRFFLQSQERYANDVLISRGHIFLNEVYDALGIPRTKEGAVVGWVLKDPEKMVAEGRDGHVSFNLFNGEYGPARDFINGYNRSVLLDFNVDGIILNEI
jgi:hypothetical protein